MGPLIEELKLREAAARAEADRLRVRIGAVTVPPWLGGADASVLPRIHQDLLEVAADAGRPLRAVEFSAAAGLDTKKAKVEGLRSRLKLLAARGWLAEAPGGLFTLPDDAGKTLKPGR